MILQPEDVLHQLVQRDPTASWAFLLHQGTVYFAGMHRPQTRKPSSAAIKLLQGLFDHHRDLTFFLLRTHLYLDAPPGPMERGFINLVAKRFRVLQVPFKCSTPPTALRWVEVVPLETEIFQSELPTTSATLSAERIIDDQQAALALQGLEDQVPRGTVLHDYARPIGAILVNDRGQVQGYAVHSGVINKTRHAEIDLIQDLYRRGFDPAPDTKYVLYVSLKPCRMCAGTWAEMFESRNLEVVYRRDDPGSKARDTELDRRGLLRELGPFPQLHPTDR